jgi:hypothetical protein
MPSVTCTGVTVKGCACRRKVIISAGVTARCYQHKVDDAVTEVGAAKVKAVKPCPECPECPECPICFDAIKKSSDGQQLKCNGKNGHTFHKTCIRMWIDKDTKPVPSCPMCRAIIMPSDISKLFKGMSKPPKPVPWSRTHWLPRGWRGARHWRRGWRWMSCCTETDTHGHNKMQHCVLSVKMCIQKTKQNIMNSYAGPVRAPRTR